MERELTIGQQKIVFDREAPSLELSGPHFNSPGDGPLLGPIFNVVSLCHHCSHVREVVTIAAKYAKRLGVNVFEVSFLADTANCDGMVAVGTDEQQDVHISHGWRDDDHLLASLRAREERGYCP